MFLRNESEDKMSIKQDAIELQKAAMAFYEKHKKDIYRDEYKLNGVTFTIKESTYAVLDSISDLIFGLTCVDDETSARVFDEDRLRHDEDHFDKPNHVYI